MKNASRQHWHLLTEKEILALSKQDLELYIAWLEEYKREKLDELQQKRQILEQLKLNKSINEENYKKFNEEDEIMKIRNFLINQK